MVGQGSSGRASATVQHNAVPALEFLSTTSQPAQERKEGLRRWATLVPAPRDISELAARFDLESNRLNEAEVKASFIEPLFGLLGWDLQDTSQVGRERKTKAGRPDYTFKTGNQLQFLVEAKKPAENLGHNSNHALQLRRYAWNTDAPLSILTNFKEFAVYDCRAKPRSQDAPTVARFLYAATPEDLAKQWAAVSGYFSHDAVTEDHSLDKFRLRRRGTERVDESLLSDVERWRRDLAHDLANRNKRNCSVD